MKERIAGTLPYAIAVLLPLAGLLIALWRLAERDWVQGTYLLLISLTAGVVWWIALSGL
jgi:hypothetical protein